MSWSTVPRWLVIGALLAPHMPIQAQTADPQLVSLDRIRAGLENPPPSLRFPVSAGQIPTFRTEVRQPFSLEPIEEEPFDPTMGLPSVGELLIGGIEKVRSAAVGYKRGRTERRAKREVKETLAAFCAVHECTVPATSK